MLQDLNLQELSFEETIQIDAGGETAYNIGKALGWSFQQIKDLGRGLIEGFSGI
ncbi:hypothetical protein [Chishuiella sp.]|uniref:hypothetical protein n=1 Tax=Chishuiella sp. TaxID=1969467 RepID=UPI0028B2340F|nr:hypothetical protein [Chishuiella sp.]